MPTHHRGSAREVRALDAYVKLMRATDALAARLSRSLDRHDLTLGQLAVLEALLHLGAMSQLAVGRKVMRSKGNVTTVIDNLESRGYVRRERSEEDRRVVFVTLTREGRRCIERVFPAHAGEIADCMSALTAREQEALGSLCKALGVAVAAGDGNGSSSNDSSRRAR